MNNTMSDDYVWSANDWSNIVTISAAAIASVLLVVFKSRCKNISLCWGMWSCQREVMEEEEETNPTPKHNPPPPPPVLVPPKPTSAGPPSVEKIVSPPASA